ncbi:MAG TPA: carbohydrate-binding protein, partial [Desulfobulbus sp.]|nr:carbohydrate-binding protein [Desulfobulbus sp.]
MARDHVRTLISSQGMSADITVYLRGGTYRLNSTFELSAADSGTNGHTIHYKSYPGETPIISGGTTIAGWSLYDVNHEIYRARINRGINFRQLYVNGKRAVRARSGDNPEGYSQNADGFSDIDPLMQGWGNQQDIEIVGFNEWRSFRCPVAEISSTSMSLRSPCWFNSTGAYQPDGGFNRVTWVENAYELLDEPDEWY